MTFTVYFVIFSSTFINWCSAMFWQIGSLVLLLGISSTALKTFKCSPWPLRTYCFVENETYHDENEDILFNTDKYTNTDYDITTFSTINGYNNFSLFPNAIFEKFPYLSSVLFINAQLKSLNQKSFSNCLGLHELNLAYNLIEHLEAGNFEKCENLVRLNLQSNRLSRIDKDAFRNLRSLETLNLFDNSITTIHQDAFNYLPNLIVLILKKNQITKLQNDTFKQLTAVWNLDLSFNKIVTIESALFHLPSMTKLELGHNRINAIQPNFFEYWPPNNTFPADILLEYNFCVKKEFLQIGSQNVPVMSVISEFAKCFKNYMRTK